MKKAKTKSNSFQTSSKKLSNGFAAAMNEPTLKFPDSDTIGGASVLTDNSMTIQQREPVYSPPFISDPIISEVAIIPDSDGGGIVKEIVGSTPLDTNMNPTPPANETGATDSTTEKPAKKFPWLMLAAVVLAVVAVIYFSKKK
jgi:hypothetical protein